MTLSGIRSHPGIHSHSQILPSQSVVRLAASLKGGN